VSHEGVVLVLRGSLAVFMILEAAIIRTFIGPSRRRGEIMFAGIFTGMATGVFVSYLWQPVLASDQSAILAVIGMTLGAGIASRFARWVPRQTN
jgi:hypothetical protein